MLRVCGVLVRRCLGLWRLDGLWVFVLVRRRRLLGWPVLRARGLCPAERQRSQYRDHPSHHRVGVHVVSTHLTHEGRAHYRSAEGGRVTGTQAAERLRRRPPIRCEVEPKRRVPAEAAAWTRPSQRAGPGRDSGARSRYSTEPPPGAPRPFDGRVCRRRKLPGSHVERCARPSPASRARWLRHPSRGGARAQLRRWCDDACAQDRSSVTRSGCWSC